MRRRAQSAAVWDEVAIRSAGTCTNKLLADAPQIPAHAAICLAPNINLLSQVVRRA
jgi:hypothetical protein